MQERCTVEVNICQEQEWCEFGGVHGSIGQREIDSCVRLAGFG